MLKIFKIKGESLYPEYRNGDYVLIAKSPFPYFNVQVGDVIAFYHADYGLMIKRINSISNDSTRIEVKGTLLESVDSSTFGPISRNAIIGKVIWHIHQKPSN